MPVAPIEEVEKLSLENMASEKKELFGAKIQN
jgi:hypothetical protein